MGWPAAEAWKETVIVDDHDFMKARGSTQKFTLPAKKCVCFEKDLTRLVWLAYRHTHCHLIKRTKHSKLFCLNPEVKCFPNHHMIAV